RASRAGSRTAKAGGERAHIGNVPLAVPRPKVPPWRVRPPLECVSLMQADQISSREPDNGGKADAGKRSPGVLEADDHVGTSVGRGAAAGRGKGGGDLRRPGGPLARLGDPGRCGAAGGRGRGPGAGCVRGWFRAAVPLERERGAQGRRNPRTARRVERADLGFLGGPPGDRTLNPRIKSSLRCSSSRHEKEVCLFCAISFKGE